MKLISKNKLRTLLEESEILRHYSESDESPIKEEDIDNLLEMFAEYTIIDDNYNFD